MSYFIAGMKKHKYILTLMLFAVLLSLSGCFTRPSKYTEAKKRTVNDGYFRSDYRKVVAILPLTVKTFLPENSLGTLFQNTFLETLKNDSRDIRFVMPDAAQYPQMPRSLDSGQVMAFGRDYGFNAVVSTAVLDIQTRAEKEGIWWFKGTQHYLQIRIQAEAVDPGTGARLASEVMAREIEIDEQNAEMIKTRQPDVIPDLAEEVLDTAEDLGEIVAEKLNAHQWRGLVIGSDDGAILIAPGANAGLGAGDRFEIFDGSRTIEGVDGRHYIVPGYKKGEIAVTLVSPNTALATLSSGETPDKGDFALPMK